MMIILVYGVVFSGGFSEGLVPVVRFRYNWFGGEIVVLVRIFIIVGIFLLIFVVVMVVVVLGF